jgi:uncharacterized membrane-anchored protein
MQFYFLSIVLNALTGFTLFTDDKREPVEAHEPFAFKLSNGAFRFVLGLLTMVMGVLSLLAATDIPVVGDIVPALAGLAGGASLVFEFYRNKATLPSEKTEKAVGFFSRNKKVFGVADLAAAALHFLFPAVLLL